MLIEVLSTTGCPSWEKAPAAAECIEAELGITAQIEARLGGSAAAARRLRSLGSPTVRVNGWDIGPGAEQCDGQALACRLYRADTGASGLPDERWLRAGLEAAR